MNSNVWIRKTLSMGLSATIFATSSMFALAAPGKAVGELTVTGSQSAAVTVNGEAAKSGRSIFSSSVISTPENAGAVINLGKSGVIELAPNTTLALSFDDKSLSGDLTSGALTVLSAAAPVMVKTASGEMSAAAGETVSAAGKRQDDDDNDGGAAWWLWALVFGGAAAGILIAATQADNDVSLGGSGTVVSPVR
ncbi:MAG: hypothetical protein ACK4S4_04900 [Pyrinomonadaceae bacterium]